MQSLAPVWIERQQPWPVAFDAADSRLVHRALQIAQAQLGEATRPLRERAPWASANLDSRG